MPSLSYRFTVADLVDARTCAYESLPLVRAARAFPFVLIAFTLAVGGWRVLQQGWSGAGGLVGWLGLGLLLIAWMHLGNRWLLPGSARKQIAASPDLQGDIAVSWTAKDIAFKTASGQSRRAWGEFVRWRETAHGLLLWRDRRAYNYLPKRAMTEDQAADVRARLEAAVGPAGKRRK